MLDETAISNRVVISTVVACVISMGELVAQQNFLQLRAN